MSKSCAIDTLFVQNNNVERAVDWIFSHLDELDTPDTSEPSAPAGEGDVPMETGVSCSRDGLGSMWCVFD